MKKQIRIAIFVDAVRSGYLTKTMALIFGKENVVSSLFPQHLFGILKTFRPTVLILAPNIFESCKIKPEDINAYRKEMKYRIVALYATEEALKTKERYAALRPNKEYFAPKDYFTMAKDIRAISTNPYTKRKEPLQNKTIENIKRIFETCGFHTNMKGAAFLEEALAEQYFNPSLHIKGGNTAIYKRLAKRHETTPRIIERSIQRFLEYSWKPEVEAALRNELKISEFYSFVPINFGRFTGIFNTYYTIKYGSPQEILRAQKKEEELVAKEN